MMTLLLDSSNRNLSVGLSDNGHVLAFKEYDAWQQQSEFMVPEIEKLLKNQSLTTSDITSIVVAVGPGSYTGVRIAVTIAKIMGFLLQAPVYEISSLAVLKDQEKPTICLANARSGRSYIGVYHQNQIVLPDQVMTNDDVLNYISHNPQYLIAGDVAYLGLEAIKSDRFSNMALVPSYTPAVENLLGLKPVYLKD